MEDILDQLKKIVPIDDKEYISDEENAEDLSFNDDNSTQPARPFSAATPITTKDILHSLSSPYVKAPQFYKDDLQFDDSENEDGPKNKNLANFAESIYQSIPLMAPLGKSIITKYKMMLSMVKEQEKISVSEPKEKDGMRSSLMKSTQPKKEKKEESSFSKKGNSSKPGTITNKTNKQKMNTGKMLNVSRTSSFRRNSSTTLNKLIFCGVETTLDQLNSALSKKTLQLLSPVLDKKQFRKIQPFYVRQFTLTKQEMTPTMELHMEPLFTLIENVEKHNMINKLS